MQMQLRGFFPARVNYYESTEVNYFPDDRDNRTKIKLLVR